MDNNKLIDSLRDASSQAVRAIEAIAKGDDHELRQAISYLQFFSGRALDAHIGDDCRHGLDQHVVARVLLGLNDKKEVAA